MVQVLLKEANSTLSTFRTEERRRVCIIEHSIHNYTCPSHACMHACASSTSLIYILGTWSQANGDRMSAGHKHCGKQCHGLAPQELKETYQKHLAILSPMQKFDVNHHYIEL